MRAATVEIRKLDNPPDWNAPRRGAPPPDMMTQMLLAMGNTPTGAHWGNTPGGAGNALALAAQMGTTDPRPR